MSKDGTLTQKLKRKIQAAEMQILRMITFVTRRDTTRNKCIGKDFHEESVLEFIEKS